jgi:hypothetical protein
MNKDLKDKAFTLNLLYLNGLQLVFLLSIVIGDVSKF